MEAGGRPSQAFEVVSGLLRSYYIDELEKPNNGTLFLEPDSRSWVSHETCALLGCRLLT